MLECAQTVFYDPYSKITDINGNPVVKFSIHNDGNINDNMQNMRNNIINNQFDNNNIIINLNMPNMPVLKCTLKFKFNKNEFQKTIDDLDNHSTTIEGVFNEIAMENRSAFVNYKNFKMELNGQGNVPVNQRSPRALAQYAIDNILTFSVSGEAVSQHDNNDEIIQESGFNFSKTQSHKSPTSGISISTWLKIIFTMLAVMGGIAAAVFEIYLLATILLALIVLIWVLSTLCSGGCCRNLNSFYKVDTPPDNCYSKSMDGPQMSQEENEKII